MSSSTFQAPYYAVIFSSTRTDEGAGDYDAMSEYMLELARQQPGFLGVESARQEIGITVSYWRDLEAIKAWRNHSEHRVAQEKGQSDWYSTYTVRIAKVEREYSWSD